MAWLRSRLIILRTLIIKLMFWPWRKSANANTWLRALAAENIAATPEILGYAAQTSGCIACGLCDVVAKAGEYPSRWISAMARNPVDAELVMVAADKLLRLGPEIEEICPSGVSATYVSRLIEDNYNALARAKRLLTGDKKEQASSPSTRF